MRRNPGELGYSCNPTFLLFFYVLVPKISVESDGKGDKNTNYNRGPTDQENRKKPEVACG